MFSGTVFEFDPAVPPSPEREPAVVWSAPQSMFIDEVTAQWVRSQNVADLARISGPWAAVLWQPSTGRYVIAHDPVGVHPVFWARTAGGRIAVSSWVAALVDRDDVSDAPDYEGVLLGELHICIPEVQHHSYFAAVSRVPWGHAVSFTSTGDPIPAVMWDPREVGDVDSSLTLADCAEMLRTDIDVAVRRLVTPGVRTGAHVSGGLDCSTMACRVNQLLGESGESLVEGYSWAPDERVTPRFPGDERAIVEDVSRAENFPISYLYPDETGDWFATRDHLRYPNTTHAREAFVLPRAAEKGIRVMFSGWGGDELASFNGRNVIKWMLHTGRFRSAWRELGYRNEVLQEEHMPFGQHARAMLGALWDSAPDSVRSLRNRESAREKRDRESKHHADLRAFSPSVAEIVETKETRLARVRTPRDMRMYLMMNGHMQQRTTYWHQTGALFDINYRYPLLDVDVVTTALRLPWWAFKNHGWTRIAYRLAVEPWVPASLVWNPLKVEPALIAPPVTNPVERLLPEPDVAPLTDERLVQIFDLARTRREPRRDRTADAAASPKAKGVLFRPDRAPLRELSGHRVEG